MSKEQLMLSKKKLLKENDRLKHLLENEQKRVIALEQERDYLKELAKIELENIYFEILQIVNHYSKLKLKFINSKISSNILFQSLDSLLVLLKLKI